MTARGCSCGFPGRSRSSGCTPRRARRPRSGRCWMRGRGWCVVVSSGGARVDTAVIETVERIRAADQANMLDRIKELSTQVRDAWGIGKAAQLPPAYADVRNITLAGMGGSAIGGDFAAALLADALQIPMIIHRDYRLPSYVRRDSLLIASSDFGNTEESLSAFGEARKR